ncbi:unnamed protein product [Schistosoma mattheei]|uniref:ethanolamine kinase n=1 Tax=Schistosoma mattheei TaxID=31246 RepID=A0A183PLU0_9TREM|nr:unnamed protein product [Schistosoma mattheei]
MVAGDQQLVHTSFVPSGYWSPCAPLVWDHGFPTSLGRLSVSTKPVKEPDIRFPSSQFRKQQPRHEKAMSRTSLAEAIYSYESIFPSKSYIFNEVIILKDQYLNSPISKVVLCHNDLNAANIILAPDENSVHLIDIEYCDLNYAAYDIGNHFCEFTGPYAIEFKRYPSIDYQKEWINIYLTAYYQYSNSKSDLHYNELQWDRFKEDYINQWIKEINCFALVSHLLWAVWAVICASENLYSMDFLAYADSRMKQYYLMKKWLPSTFQLPVV